jgi:hypothetical protein
MIGSWSTLRAALSNVPQAGVSLAANRNSHGSRVFASGRADEFRQRAKDIAAHLVSGYHFVIFGKGDQMALQESSPHHSFRSAIFTSVVVAASVFGGSVASAQITQTTVKVDGQDCTVTEMRGGRSPTHMVQLAGPAGTAMVQVDKDNKITAYLSPPGGGAYKDLIDKVWAAYLEQKSKTAPASSTPTNESADPNAALRAQAAAIAAQAQARANGTTAPASGERVVKSLNDASIVIFDPKLGTDVTISDNLMKATWTVTPKVPQGLPVAAKPENFEAFFEGGDKPAGADAKVGKLVKGTTTATLDSMNTRADATSSITSNTDVWRVNEQEGKTKKDVYESGGMRTGGYVAYTGRDPAGNQGESILVAIREDLILAKQTIEAAQKNGQAKGFDFTTDRFQRGWTALESATKDYKN